MELVNAIEPIVSSLFEEFQKQYALKCSFDQCQEDVQNSYGHRIA